MFEDITGKVKFDDKGLIAAISQDVDTGLVLMVGYMNEESLGLTLDTGLMTAGCAAAKVWVALDDRPTAVFCASDQLALGFIAELSRHGFKVPYDVSVMGFDDISIAEQFIPPLTTIRQDRLLLGETAASMLMERIEAPDGVSQKHVSIMPVSLIIRESTAPPVAQLS